MFFVDRMAAVLKPTDVFLAWLQQYDEDFTDLTLAQLRANCSVFLLPVFDVSARTLCHHFAIILSMRHDKKNAKHDNNTIIQKPALMAGLNFAAFALFLSKLFITLF